ncbi:MAG: hypothetical protein WDM78_04920 [Puia sp.]
MSHPWTFNQHAKLEYFHLLEKLKKTGDYFQYSRPFPYKNASEKRLILAN